MNEEINRDACLLSSSSTSLNVNHHFRSLNFASVGCICGV